MLQLEERVNKSFIGRLRNALYNSRLGRGLLYLTPATIIACSDGGNVTDPNTPPKWLPIANVVIDEGTPLNEVPERVLPQYVNSKDPSLEFRIINQSNAPLIEAAIPDNKTLKALRMDRNGYGENRVILVVQNSSGADTTQVVYVINQVADLIPNVRDITKEGEPKVATPTTLIFEKDGKRQELIVFPDSSKSIKLKPGEYEVIADNSNFWPYWLLGRQPGQDPCMYLVRNDTGGRGKLKIGVEDIVMDFYIINKNFPMVEYLGNIVGVFGTNGSAPWKCGLPLNVVADTTRAKGSGRPVEQRTLDAIKKVINEYLPRVKTVEGVRVYMSITYQETNNAPIPGQQPDGMLLLRANDTIRGRAENRGRVVNGYSVSGFVEFGSDVTYYNVFLKEMNEPLNNLSSARSHLYDLIVPNTIFITGGALDFALEDLILLKILNAFGPNAKFTLN